MSQVTLVSQENHWNACPLPAVVDPPPDVLDDVKRVPTDHGVHDQDSVRPPQDIVPGPTVLALQPNIHTRCMYNVTNKHTKKHKYTIYIHKIHTQCRGVRSRLKRGGLQTYQKS